MKEVEKLDNLDFQDELKTIDICAIGPLRVTASLINGGLLKEGSKVIMITSQGGSVEWRPTQCPEGGDYGHHVSCSGTGTTANIGTRGKSYRRNSFCFSHTVGSKKQ